MSFNSVFSSSMNRKYVQLCQLQLLKIVQLNRDTIWCSVNFSLHNIIWWRTYFYCQNQVIFYKIYTVRLIPSHIVCEKKTNKRKYMQVVLTQSREWVHLLFFYYIHSRSQYSTNHNIISHMLYIVWRYVTQVVTNLFRVKLLDNFNQPWDWLSEYFNIIMNYWATCQQSWQFLFYVSLVTHNIAHFVVTIGNCKENYLNKVMNSWEDSCSNMLTENILHRNDFFCRIIVFIFIRKYIGNYLYWNEYRITF